MTSAPRWFPDWRGETVVIVASGPSAKDVPLDIAKGRAKFVAVNNSWLLCPWADMLYACDARWWIQYPQWREFKGIKVSQDQRAVAQFGVKRVWSDRNCEEMKLGQPTYIGWGGNGGFHALNIVAQTAPAKIILVGFDMQVSGGTHWHGNHVGICLDPEAHKMGRWVRVVDAAAKVIAGAGITAINCSPVSALQNYPKMTFEAALDA